MKEVCRSGLWVGLMSALPWEPTRNSVWLDCRGLGQCGGGRGLQGTRQGQHGVGGHGPSTDEALGQGHDAARASACANLWV